MKCIYSVAYLTLSQLTTSSLAHWGLQYLYVKHLWVQLSFEGVTYKNMHLYCGLIFHEERYFTISKKISFSSDSFNKSYIHNGSISKQSLVPPDSYTFSFKTMNTQTSLSTFSFLFSSFIMFRYLLSPVYS